MKKRIVSVILMLLMLLQLAAVISFSASAATSGIWMYTISGGKATITGCNGSGAVIIPATLGGYPVTSIGERAFAECLGLKSITIPGSVTSIGEMAFYHCVALTSITIPGSVTSIGESAFYGCDKLESVTLPGSVISIGEMAFYDCYALTSITLQNGVKSIGDSAFAFCSGLKSITIPASVTSVGYASFSYCSGLTSINVAAQNTVYHSKGNCLIKTASKTLIAGCQNSIIPADGSVTAIGDYAFAACLGMKSLIIPDGVKSIGSFSFAECYGLTSITIPASVTSIEEDAFMYMYSSKITIRGYTGTVAESFAKWGVKFIALCDKFSDVAKSDWYHENGAIHYCADKKLFSGITATTFGPTQNMTRGMFVTVLGRLDGQKVNNKVITAFMDVKKNQYYTGYVKWAYENEIVAGTSKRKFEPNANITREQICAIMQRYSNYAGIRIKQYYKVMTFTDSAQISFWAEDAVRACQQGGLVTGEKVGASYRFRPKGNATRAEVATIIMNFVVKHI